MVAWIVRAFVILMMLAGTAITAGLSAQDPAYDVPGRLALPWTCGEGYAVTWEPAGHWAQRKASGLAYDFALPEGTPLYSPGHGHIYYLKDERPFETNLGNYVEIVVEDDWLVRLAHMRDPQSGEDEVRAGQFIGYSGRSGVSAAHLHMELFVRDGDRWIAPSQEQLETLFGLPVADLIEGAVVANDGCPAQVMLNGPVQPVTTSARLGETLDLVVPLRNDGLEPVTLDAVQVSLLGPDGAAAVARAEGSWFLDAKTAIEAVVPVVPPRPGEWSVGRVTCGAGEAVFGFSGEGAFVVAPSDLRLVGISVPPEARTGEPISLEAWVENGGDVEQRIDVLELRGSQPDGLPWTAVARSGRTIPAGEARRFELEAETVPERVGEWRIAYVGYRQDGRSLVFAGVEQTFAVGGPELRAESLSAGVEDGRLTVTLALANVGTESADLERVEVWGWKPGGDESFTMPGVLAPEEPSVLDPGGAATVRFEAPVSEDDGSWRLVEAGYWAEGGYVRVPLPEQPTVDVSGPPDAVGQTAVPDVAAPDIAAPDIAVPGAAGYGAYPAPDDDAAARAFRLRR